MTRASSDADDNIEMNSTLSFPLPANLTFVSITNGANFSCATPAVGISGTVTCTVTATPGIYLGNGVEVLQLVVNTTTDAANARTLTVTLNNLRETDPSDNSVTVVTPVTSPRTPTTTVTTSSAQPSVFGQPVTFTGTVTGAGATPTGLLSFFIDGNPGPPITLDGNGHATLTIATLSIGTHTVCGYYLGDSDNLPSCGPLAGDQIVTIASTTTTLVSSQNPSVIGETVLFTATVAPVAPGAGSPSGSVTFSIDGATQATVALSAGSATFTAAGLSEGTHAITASYSGDATFAASVSNTVAQSVGKIATTATLASSLNPSQVGEAVTFTASVNAAGGSPTGSVTFSIDGVAQAPVALTGGSASFTTSALAAGSRTIGASYGGDATFAGASAPVLNQSVVGRATTTKVASSHNPSRQGETVTLTASVTSASGTPTGPVVMRIDGVALAPVPLAGGAATVTTPSLAAGTHVIVAAYGGDAVFAGSTSPSIAQEVTATTGSVTIREVTDAADGEFTFSSPTAALNLSVATVSGRGESAATAVPAGIHVITAADLRGDGVALTGIACSDAESVGNVATRSATVSLAPGESVICTFTSVDARTRTSQIISDFLATRADLILANQPDTDSRIGRLNGVPAGSSNPISALMGYVPGAVAGGPVSVSTSLNALRRMTGTGEAQSPFDIWFRGTYASLDTDAGDGDFGLCSFGADYIVNPDLLVGATVQIDRLSLSEPGSEVSGTGWLAGPYATARLAPNLFLDVVAAAGTSSNTISPYGTYSDSFDTTRWMAQATLAGDWRFGAWTFSPGARIGYFSDGAQAYSDSLGVAIPDISASLGQFAFSPEIGYRFDTDAAIIDTSLKLEGIFNIGDDRENTGFGSARGRVVAGVDVGMPSGMRLGFATAYDGIGSDDLTAISGTVKISMPLN